MNKNLKKVGTMVLVAIVAVGAYFVSGTYAKYTSTMSGKGSASVAKWAWKINDRDFTTVSSVSQEFTFNPFASILDTKDGEAETDVDTKLIAPGTKGNITLDITNNSEVNAEYKVEFSVTNTSNIPLEYSLDGQTWVADIAELNLGTTTPIAIEMGKSATTRTLQWKWVFEKGTGDTLTANDAADTALGFAANTTRPEVEVKAKVTVTQVD